MDPNVDYWQVPSAKPPEGVTPNFVNPKSIGNHQTVTNIVVLVVMIVVVLLRIWTRAFIVKSVGYDDCTWEESSLIIKETLTDTIDRGHDRLSCRLYHSHCSLPGASQPGHGSSFVRHSAGSVLTSFLTHVSHRLGLIQLLDALHQARHHVALPPHFPHR
jgi:hypothetical protein